MSKDINNRHRNQTKRFYNYLSKHTVTCSMASRALRINQKCLTRYKRQLEKAGLLWELKKDRCALTGHPAAWLTSNQELVSHLPQQLKFQL